MRIKTRSFDFYFNVFLSFIDVIKVEKGVRNEEN